MYEKRGENLELYYYYDSFSTISGLRMVKDGVSTDYIFLTNWRGDVETIYDGTGTLQARYTYDAWGNVTSITDENGSAITDETHIANVNPIRYRGYYQDAETGFYYLQSRYYDPVTHRMLNSDAIAGEVGNATSHNVFAYAFNNPVNAMDENGNWPKWMKKAYNQVTNFFGISDASNAYAHPLGGYKAQAPSASSNVQLRSGKNNGKTEVVGGHSKNKRPSTKKKHEEGDSRRLRDQARGEKGDKRRNPNPNKRPHITMISDRVLPTLIVVGVGVAIVYVVANDITGVGVADNALLIPLFTTFATKSIWRLKRSEFYVIRKGISNI